MNNKALGLFCVGLMALAMLAQPVSAQYHVLHQSPAVIEKGSTIDFSFRVPGIHPGEVQDAFLFYRLDGGVAFRQINTELNQSTFHTQVTIPANESGSGTMEYYFEISLTNGQKLDFPENLSFSGPVRVEILEPKKRTDAASGTMDPIGYTILSPERNEHVASSDVVIAITLFYDESAIDSSNHFQLTLDGTDITKKANASNYFLTYVPTKELAGGIHSVSLSLLEGDSKKELTAWTFNVVNPEAVTEVTSEDATQSFVPSGQVELSARNQVIAGSTNDALSGNFRLAGQKRNIRYSAYGLLTSQENPRLQPQNRYGAELYVGDWFEFQAGHIYPTLSLLTIAGQRVQGINTAFHIFDRALNLQFLYGKLRRSISNLYGNIEMNEQHFNGVVVDTSYALNFQDNGAGIFQRDVLGGRLELGRGRHFEMGFNALKVQDDTNSVKMVNNYNDLVNIYPSLAQNLSPTSRHKLQANPNQLSVNGNPSPEGNFVAGSDLMVNLDKNRIQFRADGALSLLNEDISGGVLTAERADELGFDIGNNVENILDQLSWLIIINEHMNALPLHFKTDGNNTTAEAFFPTSIVATQSELSFGYFQNNLRLQYRWVGPEYNSLANTTVRKDIAGYTISDRFRLFQNQIYITLGYENLNDNVIHDKDATTHTGTLRSNISWYPIKQELPRLSIGLMNRNRKNGVSPFNPYVSSPLETAAVKNYDHYGSNVVIAPTARLANTLQFTSSVSQQIQLLGITHDASLNYSILNTNDDYFVYGDARSSSISFNVTDRFNSLPLNTNWGLSINNTKISGGLTNIKIMGVNIGGSLYLMNDNLNINTSVAFTQNTSNTVPLTVSENGSPNDDSDDYYKPDSSEKTTSETNSYILSAGARYSINKNHAFLVDMRFTNVINPLTGGQIPNDHILQARYIFSF